MTRPLENNPKREQLGQRMQRLRKALGISQYKMADRTGISYTQIRHLENSRTNYSVDSLKRVALALGCTSDYLIGIDDDPGPQWVGRKIE